MIDQFQIEGLMIKIIGSMDIDQGVEKSSLNIFLSKTFKPLNINGPPSNFNTL